MTEQERQYVRQLEQAVLEAESVMADWQAALRKGYIRNAQRVVSSAADCIRYMQKRTANHSNARSVHKE